SKFKEECDSNSTPAAVAAVVLEVEIVVHRVVHEVVHVAAVPDGADIAAEAHVGAVHAVAEEECKGGLRPAVARPLSQAEPPLARLDRSRPELARVTLGRQALAHGQPGLVPLLLPRRAAVSSPTVLRGGVPMPALPIEAQGQQALLSGGTQDCPLVSNGLSSRIFARHVSVAVPASGRAQQQSDTEPSAQGSFLLDMVRNSLLGRRGSGRPPRRQVKSRRLSWAKPLAPSSPAPPREHPRNEARQRPIGRGASAWPKSARHGVGGAENGEAAAGDADQAI
ncbi:hypothetical protein THAOC_09735, partial [Thalassiosira oceanica]